MLSDNYDPRGALGTQRWLHVDCRFDNVMAWQCGSYGFGCQNLKRHNLNYNSAQNGRFAPLICSLLSLVLVCSRGKPAGLDWPAEKQWRRGNPLYQNWLATLLCPSMLIDRKKCKEQYSLEATVNPEFYRGTVAEDIRGRHFKSFLINLSMNDPWNFWLWVKLGSIAQSVER